MIVCTAAFFYLFFVILFVCFFCLLLIIGVMLSSRGFVGLDIRFICALSFLVCCYFSGSVVLKYGFVWGFYIPQCNFVLTLVSFFCRYIIGTD